MNKSVRRESMRAAGPIAPGEVLVATAFRHSERGLVDCRGARLLGGSLRRRGLKVRYGQLDATDTSEPAGSANTEVVTYLERDEAAVGLAAVSGDDVPRDLVSAALDEWAAVLRTRRAVVAGRRPWCAGVDQAARRVRDLLAGTQRPVYVYGASARSTAAFAELEQAGAVFVDRVEDVPDGSPIVFGAAGAPLAALALAAARGLRVVDATCHLVGSASRQIRRFAADGTTVMLIGQPGHAVTAALLDAAPTATVLISDENDAATAPVPVVGGASVAYVLAPGVPAADAAPAINALRSRFVHVRPQFPGDYCHAAADRRDAIRALAGECELLLIAGAARDADRAHVARIASGHMAVVRTVSAVEDVDPSWLAQAGCVGLTAALSAPRGLLDQLSTALAGIGPLAVAERQVITEPANTTIERLTSVGEVSRA